MQGQQYTDWLHAATLGMTGCSGLYEIDDRGRPSRCTEKICELLARPNVEMHECATGEEAMWSVHDFQPDWIIMDVHLPGVNGFEATEAIRKEVPSARVIMISADDKNYLRETARAAGAEEFLCKHDLARLPRVIYGEAENSPMA